MTTKIKPNQNYIDWLKNINRKEGGLINKKMLSNALGISLGGACNKVTRDKAFKIIKYNDKDKGHISLNDVIDYIEEKKEEKQ